MSRKPNFDNDAAEEDGNVGSPPSRSSMNESKIALFIDFENIAIGVADAKFKKFEVALLLERLLEALLEQGDGQVHVLAGPGGAGKSTIALRLAGKAAGHGMPAWRVPAAGTETMTGELLGLAAGLGGPPGEVDQARAGQRSPADLAGWPSLVTPIPGLAWAG